MSYLDPRSIRTKGNPLINKTLKTYYGCFQSLWFIEYGKRKRIENTRRQGLQHTAQGGVYNSKGKCCKTPQSTLLHGHSSYNIESPTSKRTLWENGFPFCSWMKDGALPASIPAKMGGKTNCRIYWYSVSRFRNKKGLVITTSNYNRLVGGFCGPRCVFTQNMFMVHVKHLQITIMIWMTFVDSSTRLLRTLFLGGWAVWEFMQCLSNRNSE